jgi:hypothetical protein
VDSVQAVAVLGALIAGLVAASAFLLGRRDVA